MADIDPSPQCWFWWSSGKDSAYALMRQRQSNSPPVTALVTTVTQPYDRVAIHGVRRNILKAQAQALGLPLYEILLPAPCTNEEYMKAVTPLQAQAKEAGVTHMGFGDIFLQDVRQWRDELFAKAGLKTLYPIWEMNTKRLAEEILATGIEAYISCLDPKRLPAKWVGKRYDRTFLEALPETVDPCGENGEFHTVVADGSMFSRRLELVPGVVVERDGMMYADFTSQLGH